MPSALVYYQLVYTESANKVSHKLRPTAQVLALLPCTTSYCNTAGKVNVTGVELVLPSIVICSLSCKIQLPDQDIVHESRLLKYISQFLGGDSIVDNI